MADKAQCILISSGSNINREENTQKGLTALENAFGPLVLSPVYESESIGFKGDNFYNLAVMAYTTKSVAQVCQTLKQIEDACGRKRNAVKFSSRTLDLDLLTYGQMVCSEPVHLPRGEITENAFVLRPMADIVPEHVHPVTQQTYDHMWHSFDKNAQQLWPVPFIWKSALS